MEILFPTQLKDARIQDLVSPYRLLHGGAGDGGGDDSLTQTPQHNKETTTTTMLDERFLANLTHMSRLGSPYYSQLLHRSKLVLLVTVPFYAVVPAALLQLDLAVGALLTTTAAAATETTASALTTTMTTMATECTVFREWGGGLVSLPLAYNLIRWFSYSRCVQTATFLATFLRAQQQYRPALELERDRLRQLLLLRGEDATANTATATATTTSSVSDSVSEDEAERQLLREHCDRLEKTLASSGISVVEDPRLSAFTEPFFDQVAAGSVRGGGVGVSDGTTTDTTDTTTTVYMDKRTAFHIAKAYGIHPPHLMRDLTKAVDRLRMQARLEQAQTRERDRRELEQPGEKQQQQQQQSQQSQPQHHRHYYHQENQQEQRRQDDTDKQLRMRQ